jgi:hypothetical protein
LYKLSFLQIQTYTFVEILERRTQHSVIPVVIQLLLDVLVRCRIKVASDTHTFDPQKKNEYSPLCFAFCASTASNYRRSQQIRKRVEGRRGDGTHALALDHAVHERTREPGEELLGQGVARGLPVLLAVLLVCLCRLAVAIKRRVSKSETDKERRTSNEAAAAMSSCDVLALWCSGWLESVTCRSVGVGRQEAIHV